MVYLNSSIEGVEREGTTREEGEFSGGSTHFPEYDTHILPKRGKAIFWFNTVERPDCIDSLQDVRMSVNVKSRHAGNEVHSGIKWVCNRWVHPVSLLNGVRDEQGMHLEQSLTIT